MNYYLYLYEFSAQDDEDEDECSERKVFASFSRIFFPLFSYLVAPTYLARVKRDAAVKGDKAAEC